MGGGGGGREIDTKEIYSIDLHVSYLDLTIIMIDLQDFM